MKVKNILLSALLIPTLVNGYELYISPDGKDDNPGTYLRPIASLQKANEILEDRAPDEDVVVYLISNREKYEIRNTIWTYSNSHHRTTITSFPDSIMATFSAAEYKGSAFITFQIAGGAPTNIHIDRIRVEDCSCRAFLFMGDPKDPEGWNGCNTISNCSFNNIGNYNYPDKHVAYSVIGFVNSRHNKVYNCEFNNIKNHTAATYPQKRIQLADKKRDKGKYPNILEYEQSNKRAGGHNPNLPIICIYFAHHCDSNQVSSNAFLNVKGDVVRIRDNTTNLVFSNNKTLLSGWSAIITSWQRKEEMFSRKVTIVDNEFVGNWLYGMPAVFKELIASKDYKENIEPSIVIENNIVREHDLLP